MQTTIVYFPVNQKFQISDSKIKNEKKKICVFQTVQFQSAFGGFYNCWRSRICMVDHVLHQLLFDSGNVCLIERDIHTLIIVFKLIYYPEIIFNFKN